MNIKKSLIYAMGLMLIVAFVFTISLTNAKAAKYNWRFALEEIEGSYEWQVGMKFKDYLEKKSNGEIKVDLYPYGQLGTIQQFIELTMNGTLEFCFGTPGHLGAYIPETQIFVLHYLFPSDREVLNKMLKQ